MTDFWIGAGALTCLALAFLLIPLWREQRRGGKKSLSGLLTAFAIVPVSVGLYFAVRTYDPNAAVHGGRDEQAVLAELADKLKANPDDVAGWELLGRSYLQLEDYERARLAFEQAWTRTANPDDDLKLAYAESILFSQQGTSIKMAGDLVEQVLKNQPNNQRALLWGGLIAQQRNDKAVAVERWTALLATNPPPQIADVVRQELAGLGAPVPSSGNATGTSPAAASGPAIEMDVSLGDNVNATDFGPNALLFIIARSPDSPMPIAVIRQPVSALPGHFTLSDANALMPGRTLSQYDTVDIVARISRTGEPTEQSGDAYAETMASPGSGEPLELVIDQIVP